MLKLKNRFGDLIATRYKRGFALIRKLWRLCLFLEGILIQESRLQQQNLGRRYHTGGTFM
jgi:hypothetical protein